VDTDNRAVVAGARQPCLQGGEADVFLFQAYRRAEHVRAQARYSSCSAGVGWNVLPVLRPRVYLALITCPYCTWGMPSES
jgi:hypothetical protein